MTPGERRGFGLPMLLGMILVLGAGIRVTSELWSSVAARDRENELVFRLRAYRYAIARYRQVYRGGPRRLEDLLDNPRRIKFMQRLYRDPVFPEGAGVFDVVRGRGGGIEGVKSRNAAPARNGVPYSEWKIDRDGRLSFGDRMRELGDHVARPDDRPWRDGTR